MNEATQARCPKNDGGHRWNASFATGIFTCHYCGERRDGKGRTCCPDCGRFLGTMAEAHASGCSYRARIFVARRLRELELDDATQARCPECGHNLGDWAGPHVPGCGWAREQARGMQGRVVFVEEAVPVTEADYERVLRLRNGSTIASGSGVSSYIGTEPQVSYAFRFDHRGRHIPEVYPQEPEEPRPATVWEPVKGWFR